MGERVFFGRFELRSDERMLLLDGEPVRLGGRAFDILMALVDRRDRIVEFDELLDVVWPGLAVEENNLSVQVSALRKLLGTGAITTVRGRGYRFTAALDASPVPVRPAANASEWDSTARKLAPQCAVLVGHVNRVLRGNGGMEAGAAVQALLRAVPDASSRCVNQADGSFTLVFPHARAAVSWALKARIYLSSQSMELEGRLGIAQASGGLGDVGGQQADATCAAALASHAANGETLAAPEVMAQLIPGLDAEIDDLGDLRLAGGIQRAYRLGPVAYAPPAAARLDSDQGGYRPSIAVLPFEALLSRDGNDPLGDALADEVIESLIHLPDVCVVSGLSSRRLRRCGLTLSGQASCLSAHYLLSGSYRHVGGALWLQVQLLDVRHGAVLECLQLQTNVEDAFHPVASIGRPIAQAVGRSVLKHSVERSRTAPLQGLENYTLLMGAIGLLHQASERDFQRARTMLEHLSQRPGCEGVAAAWSAKWHVLRVVQGWSPEPSVDARHALDCVRRSLDDDSRDALALAIGGLVHAYLFKDLDTAGAMYSDAIDANPSEPLAWLFSATRFAYLGQGTQAEEAGERALSLSPLDPMKYFMDSLAATAMLGNRRWERSVSLSRQSAKANRLHASTWRTMAIGLVMLDRMDEARDAVRQLLRIEPGLTVAEFRDRFPGRSGPLAQPWSEALQLAGLPA